MQSQWTFCLRVRAYVRVVHGMGWVGWVRGLARGWGYRVNVNREMVGGNGTAWP